MFPIYHGWVIINEDWDISVTCCPMIRIPFPWINDLSTSGNLYMRQFVMTETEFHRRAIDLF